MTVHKAKGLQFPVVIITEAGKPSQGGKNERILDHAGSRAGRPAQRIGEESESTY